MTLLHREQAAWADKPNTLALHTGEQVPSPQTSVTVFVCSPTRLVLVEVKSRGWDLPGGHIEAGENAVMAAVREVREEAGLLLAPEELVTVGWCHLYVQAPKPVGYAYPYPHTYQPQMAAFVSESRVDELATLVPEEIARVEAVPFTQLANLAMARTNLAFLPAVQALTST